MTSITLNPSKLTGNVRIPSSKSISHRAIIAASLANGQSIVSNVDISEDIQATLECMEKLGAKYIKKDNEIHIDGTNILTLKEDITLDCHESGSTLRFLMPLAILGKKEVSFLGKGRLMSRPQKPYFDLFDKKNIHYSQDEDCIKIKGNLHGGEYKIAGDISSQFITGLLFTLPNLLEQSEIIITTNLESIGYVDLTIDVLQDFGINIENKGYKRFTVLGNQQYKPVNYTVESDFSNAAFFLVAGAIGNNITSLGLKANSLQGDKQIIDILKNVGANIRIDNQGGIKVAGGNLTGTTIDAKDIPDLVPILTVLCSFCKGESKIINAGRLRLKESDRLCAIATELNKLGAKVEEGEDFLKVVGVDHLNGGVVDSWNDHRIAMSLAVASTRCLNDVTITDKDAVNKSYPNFWNDFRKMM